jgi:hypothetical protein
MKKEPSQICVEEAHLGLDMLCLWMKSNVKLLMSDLYPANIQCYVY